MPGLKSLRVCKSVFRLGVDEVGHRVVLMIRDSAKNTKGEPKRWQTTLGWH